MKLSRLFRRRGRNVMGYLLNSRKYRPLCIFLILPAAVVIWSCSGDSEYKRLDFSKTVLVPRPHEGYIGAEGLRVAVAAMISPKETVIYYRQLLDYIGAGLKMPIQLIQRKTYQEIDELFASNGVDLAFVCTGPYAIEGRLLGLEALATPVVRGEPFYQSYLIVNRGSHFQTLEDLKGRVFALTDPESNPGALVPKYWLARRGQSPDRFFKETVYTYSHDNSIMAVARGLVDGAAVDGHKWEYYNRRSPYYTARTRIIKKSRLVGAPPLVASRSMKYDLRKKISSLLLSMHNDPEGHRILKELMIDRFTEPQPQWYQPVRDMYRLVRSVEKDENGSQKS